MSNTSSSSPLFGLRVLDLSRVLAGPYCTQLLGDMGAEIIKIEKPGKGDDTRGWGPPFLKNDKGQETSESAYYLSTNRNKKSVAIDISKPEGQEIIRKLAAKSDILVENFRTGDLARYSLDYASLKVINPRLIYCSITGFGQDGPLASQPGYDFMVQGMGGIMSLTGFPDAQGGEPTKVGVAIADVMCGMYAAVGILGALQARYQTGEGQYIDVALFDTQLAWLINQGQGYLLTGETPPRRGNEHPTIVPYGTFPAADTSFIIAVGNDEQFRRLCKILEQTDLADDARFSKNADRVRNREILIPILRKLTIHKKASEWIALMEKAGIPGGPINNLQEAFTHPQARHRDMIINMSHALAQGGHLPLIGNPLKFSQTPVSYSFAPPVLGEHTYEVLQGYLGMNLHDITELEKREIINQASNNNLS